MLEWLERPKGQARAMFLSLSHEGLEIIEDTDWTDLTPKQQRAITHVTSVLRDVGFIARTDLKP